MRYPDLPPEFWTFYNTELTTETHHKVLASANSEPESTNNQTGFICLGVVASLVLAGFAALTWHHTTPKIVEMTTLLPIPIEQVSGWRDLLR